MTYEQYIKKLCLLLEKKGYKKDHLRKMSDKKIEDLADAEKVIKKTNFKDWCLKNYSCYVLYNYRGYMK